MASGRFRVQRRVPPPCEYLRKRRGRRTTRILGMGRARAMFPAFGGRSRKSDASEMQGLDAESPRQFAFSSENVCG